MLTCAVSGADQVTDLSPSWIDNYAIWSGRADLGSVNHSYLQNRKVGLVTDPWANEIGSLMDQRRILEWRQQYDDLNRDYDQRRQAGLSNPTFEQAHTGAMAGFSNGVWTEIQNRKLRQAGDKAVHQVEKSEVAKTVLAPGAVVAGLWIGRPVRFRMNDDLRFVFRTSLRNRNGQIELLSPIMNGTFEYHPQAPNSYSLISSGAVDFGRMMDLNHIADFQTERYQFKLARALPFLDLSSSFLYASSSNVLAGSLTKQLTVNLSAVVDSIYYLTPYDPDRAAEQRVRLRYDLHF